VFVKLGNAQSFCVSVINESSVELNWIEDSFPTLDNNQIQIFSSQNTSGPFTQQGIINNNIESYTVSPTLLNTNNQLNYFYLAGLVNGNIQVLTDTISTVLLTNGSTNNYEALLNWNYFNTGIDSISLYENVDNNGWNLVRNFFNEESNYLYVVKECNENIALRISVFKDDCENFSNIINDNFEDRTAPSIPEINFVTVDTLTNRSVVNWNQTPEIDTEGYNIVRLNNGNTNIIAQVLGAQNTNFLYAASQAANQSELFSVQSFDDCIAVGNSAPNTSPTNPVFHSSIFLDVESNFCSRTNVLNWNAYQGWDNVERYEIYVSENGFTFQLIENTSALNYLHENIGLFTNYCYLVKAIKQGENLSSLSNKACLASNVSVEPVFCNITEIKATANAISLTVVFDAIGNNNTFFVERSRNNGPFEIVGTLTGALGQEEFIDILAEPTQLYRYRVVISDQCSDPIVVSNIEGNMVLNASISDAYEEVFLNWRTLGSSNFEVQNVILVQPEPRLIIDVVNNNDFTTRHDISNLDSISNLCYVIETESENGFSYSSNISCVEAEPLIYTPTAFLIGGNSNVFKPVISFAKSDNYLLKIFSRWGELVFQTEDISNGWDGFINGTQAPFGIYFWQASYLSGNSKKFESSGSFTLLVK